MGLITTSIALLCAFTAYADAVCSVTNWASSFDKKGMSRCDKAYRFINGFYRSPGSGHGIDLVDEVECCRRPNPWRFSDYVCVHTNWWYLLDNNHRWATCPDGFFLNGLWRNGGGGGELHLIEEGRCVKPADAPRYFQDCYDQDVGSCLDNQGWCDCDRHNYFVAGFWRGNCDKLNCIDKLRCCRPAEAKETLDELYKVKNYIMDLTLRDMSHLAHFLGFAWCMGCRSRWVGDDFYRSGDNWVADKSERCSGYKSGQRLGLAFGDWSFGTKTIRYGTPVIDDLQPETVDSGVLENNVDSTATKTISRTENSVRSVTHETTSSWKQSHELQVEISYSPPGGSVSGRVAYTFGYESSSTTTDSESKQQVKAFTITSSKTLAPFTSVAWKMVLSKTRTTLSYTAVILVKFSTAFQGFLRWGGGPGKKATNYHVDHTGSGARPTTNFRFGNANKPFYTDLHQQVSTGSRPWLWHQMKNAWPDASRLINRLTDENRYTLNLSGKFVDVVGKQAHFSWDPPTTSGPSPRSGNGGGDGPDHRVITTVARTGPNDLPAPNPSAPQVTVPDNRSGQDTAQLILGEITDELQ